MATLAEYAEALAEAALHAKRRERGRSRKFYQSLAWKKLRYATLAASDGRCSCCGASRADGEVLQVDHIEPLSRAWDRRFDPTNVQVFCGSCNFGKLNGPARDWRVAV